MQKLRFICAILLLGMAGLCAAQTTIPVTTASDEDNDRKTNLPGDTFPLSTGCSLREAIAIVQANGTNNYPNDCAPTGSGQPYTINLGGKSITLGAPVPDPSLQDGTTKQYSTSLTIPSISLGGLPPTFGKVILLGPGTVGCDSTADMKMFIMSDDSDFTLTGMSMGPCTADGGGIAVTNNGGNLTINTVTFTGIVSKSGGNGGAIFHNEGTNLGSLIVDNAHFTGCIADDGSNLPNGPGAGNGGAFYITTVELPNVVTFTNSTFQGDIAGDSGGAIYWSNTDSLGHSFSLKNTTFTANIARGSGIEHGGGAIYAKTDQDTLDSFLIIGGAFTGNQALSGSGGAIMLAGAQLAYLDASSPASVLTGGIVAVNFSGNQALGAATVDHLEGSGGAIFSEGNLTILASSLVGNSSTGSGGAIALRNQSTNLNPTVIANTTINNNSAGQSGGGVANINSNGKLQLINATLDSNTSTASSGGQLYNTNNNAGEVVAKNTILSNGGSSGNCAPTNAITDGGHNLQHNPDTGCAAITVGDPMLNGPSPFGGVLNPLVLTMSLKAGSAASGTGDQAGVCAVSPVFNLDENGSGRPSGKPNCDIGAYEDNIVPDMTVTKSHSGSFTQGDTGKTYTITVTNSPGAHPDTTLGTVTLTEHLPAGLTATAFGGAGWQNCTSTAVAVVGPADLSCNRTDALAAGAPYPDITVTVNVAPDANVGTPGLTNSTDVAGGSESVTNNDHADDPTTIIAGTTPVRLQSFEVE